MGQALAAAFLRSGHPTTVWNRTPAKAADVVAQGARLADSVGDAVAASPLVVVCVSDYDAVHELLDPLGEVLDGRVLVNLTSGTSQTAREAAEWAARRGSTYLDGAIMAAPPAIGTPDAAILYSGPRSAFDLHQAAMSGLGVGTTYLGDDHGLSSLHYVALLSVMWILDRRGCRRSRHPGRRGRRAPAPDTARGHERAAARHARCARGDHPCRHSITSDRIESSQGVVLSPNPRFRCSRHRRMRGQRELRVLGTPV